MDNKLIGAEVTGNMVTLQLVKTVSLETIKMLQVLHADAARGDLIGFVSCSIYRRHEYGYTVAGAALTHPVMAPPASPVWRTSSMNTLIAGCEANHAFRKNHQHQCYDYR